MNENYLNGSQMMAQKSQGIIGGECVDRNPTVGENIDSKIAILKREIERLEQSKVELAPLMNMRIRDIRDAMSY